MVDAVARQQQAIRLRQLLPRLERQRLPRRRMRLPVVSAVAMAAAEAASEVQVVRFPSSPAVAAERTRCNRAATWSVLPLGTKRSTLRS
jgi:hypothetical protein